MLLLDEGDDVVLAVAVEVADERDLAVQREELVPQLALPLAAARTKTGAGPTPDWDFLREPEEVVLAVAVHVAERRDLLALREQSGAPAVSVMPLPPTSPPQRSRMPHREVISDLRTAWLMFTSRSLTPGSPLTKTLATR